MTSLTFIKKMAIYSTNLIFSSFRTRLLLPALQKSSLKVTRDFKYKEQINRGYDILKFMYSEKATKFCKISALLLTGATKDKSKVELSKSFVAFYMSFKVVNTASKNEFLF